MKKICIVLSALLVSAVSFSSLAFAGHDPYRCSVEINYHGQDFGGQDDGMTEAEAINEAKEEACERACRKGGDVCERDCMAHAILRTKSCQSNPKHVADYGKSDEVFCRALIRFEGQEMEASDSAKNLEKAKRDAKEEACDHLCDNRGDEKRCERNCRINAEVIGMDCSDRNKKPLHQSGKFKPAPAPKKPVLPPPAIAPHPGQPIPPMSNSPHPGLPVPPPNDPHAGHPVPPPAVAPATVIPPVPPKAIDKKGGKKDASKKKH